MNGVSEPDAFDMTDWSRWTQLLWAHFAQWLDSVFVVIVNGFILGLAAISGVIGYIVIDPMSAWILPRIVKPFKVPAKKDQKQQQNISSLISSWIQPNGSTTMIPPTSLVSASTPTLFQKFAERIKRDGRFVEQAVVEGICRVPNSVEAKARPPFNTAMAQLFLHLSALAYEHVDVVEHYAGLYGLKVETVSSSGCSGDDGVNARAAATVFYSVECNFVVLVFSGPSPLDISELLTSATIQKQKPGKDVLPGQIHETFWNALDFSPLDTKLSDKATFSSGTDNTCPLRISELLHVLEAKVLPQFDERKTTTNSSTAHHQHELVSKGFPFIWVTGHSLGAALATVVLAHLVHTRHSLVPFLKGCYTFGSPKCGDTEFATEVSKCCTASQGLGGLSSKVPFS
ncbi:hypothetical protein BDR26DRAFT_659460 [Obelidium mucronatum]|nr:hypothetical protein BDR26DRAFT_659460 [Obelidium mucronatum]